MKSPFVEYKGIPHLNIPPTGVGGEANGFCVCSLWSVIQYFHNDYPDRGVNLGTDTMSKEDLHAVLSTDEGGWRPKQAVLTQISNQVRSISLSLESWTGTPPKELVSHAREHISAYCPLIAFIDALQIREDTDQPGPIYSMIVAGCEDKESVVIDPWQGTKKIVKNQKLEAAWDPEMHQLITVEPIGR